MMLKEGLSVLFTDSSASAWASDIIYMTDKQNDFCIWDR